KASEPAVVAMTGRCRQVTAGRGLTPGPSLFPRSPPRFVLGVIPSASEESRSGGIKAGDPSLTLGATIPPGLPGIGLATHGWSVIRCRRLLINGPFKLAAKGEIRSPITFKRSPIVPGRYRVPHDRKRSASITTISVGAIIEKYRRRELLPMQTIEKLAIDGGQPVYAGAW